MIEIDIFFMSSLTPQKRYWRPDFPAAYRSASLHRLLLWTVWPPTDSGTEPPLP